MLVTRRHALAVAAVSVAGPALAKPAAVKLVEDAKPGDLFKYEIGLSLTGKMKVDRGGRTEPLPLASRARHYFTERVEAAAVVGVGKVVRHYSDAQSETAVGPDRSKRALPADRRLIVAQRAADGTLHYSPAGPLTRDELDLVAEHFDTLCLPGLLPGKEVSPGDTWPIPDAVAQAACLFNGTVKNQLVGKFTGMENGHAMFDITGTAEGVENGATVSVKVQARGKFDPAAGRVVALAWDQTDDRQPGPVNPAAEVRAEVTVSRVPVTDAPAELKAAVLPADDKVPATMTVLRYGDAAGKFRMTYPRDWHVVVSNNTHLVLRLVAGGELVAQATLAEWKGTKPTTDLPTAAGEFKAATNRQPGWQPAKVIEEGTVPSDAGRQVYRLQVTGTQDGLAVVQGFHLVLAADGRAVAVSVVAKPDQADKLGTRDVQLVNAVEFGK